MQNSLPLETVDALLGTADQQIQDGKLSEAGATVKRALALDPGNHAVLNRAAKIAMRTGNIKDAEQFARRSAQEKPTVPYVLTLAEILSAKEDFDEAARYYLLILKRVPNEQQSLLGLADIYEKTGHRSLAIDYTERALALTPHDLNLFRKFSKLVPFTQSPRILTALENAKPTEGAPLGALVQYGSSFATTKEYAERATRGLGSHARTLSDLFFTYGGEKNTAYEALLDSIIERGGSTAIAAQKGMCLLARGARKESEEYFRLRAEAEPNSVYANVNFNDYFYLSLETKSDDELFGHLPELIDVVTPQFDDAPIIFLSCDYNYYLKFACSLLLSINHIAQAPQVHLHIMDASAEQQSNAKQFAAKLTNTKIAISSEITGMPERGREAARGYYHAIRFIRMYQHLKRYNKPMWQMDVDGIMNRDPAGVFSAIGDADVALWGLPGRWEPWSQFNASIMGIRPTPKGAAYLRLIAAYISEYHNRDMLYWGIDQLAMFSVHEFLKDQGRNPAVTMVHSDVVDGECRPDTIIWSNGGIGKFSPLKLSNTITSSPPDSPRVRYFAALKTFTDQV